MKTTSSLSLNDIFLKGFKVQPDLCDMLVTDIKKMYRQIRINPNQRFLQN